MGGHLGGETASAMVVETVHTKMIEAMNKPDYNPGFAIAEAILAANRAIYARSSEDSELKGMGTTTTALLFHGETLHIGHVGDSRCYFLRPSELWQITRDHSMVQEKLRAGLITREQIRTDRMKNVITRSVGFEPELAVECYQMKVQAGDTFLLCSDGLSGQIEDPDLLLTFQNSLFDHGDPVRTVLALIERANASGGDDNITAIVVQVESL